MNQFLSADGMTDVASVGQPSAGVCEASSENCLLENNWYVLRDLRRPNSSQPAYKVLAERGLRVFTPMSTCVIKKKNQVVKEKIPYIHGLLFVYGNRETLDPVVETTQKLQYRFLKGRFKEPMIVPTDEMDRFIAAVCMSDDPKYLMPEEITPSMYGAKVKIVGGSLDGQTCRLLKRRGSKHKRIIVEIPNLIAVCVEVKDFEYVITVK